MAETRKNIVKEIPLGERISSAEFQYKMWTVIHTDTGGWTENEMTINIYKDGRLAIYSPKDSVIILPWQVEELLKILNNHYEKGNLK